MSFTGGAEFRFILPVDSTGLFFGSLDKAGITLTGRPNISCPCNWAIAANASCSSGISTNPNPRDFLPFFSITMATEVTRPKALKALSTSFSLASKDKLPTKIFIYSPSPNYLYLILTAFLIYRLCCNNLPRKIHRPL